MNPTRWTARLAVAVIAFAFSLLFTSANAFRVDPLLDGTVAVTLTVSGDNVELARAEANEQAVRACVGRIFLGGELIVAQNLLGNYLKQSASRFVRSVETIKTDYVEGRAKMDVRVYVDYPALQNDLREKRFAYVPAPRPMFHIFLAEMLEDKFADYSTGREALRFALKDRNLRPYEGEIDKPPTNSDVAGDPLLLDDAIVACERNGVELLVSGKATTRRDSQKDLYYDTFHFYTTSIESVLIRVDTGEVIGRAQARASASHPVEAEAIKLSIQKAALDVSNQLSEQLFKVWGVMVQEKANYRLLLTGVTPKTLLLVKEALNGFSQDAEVYVRQSFDRTAVLSIKYSGERSTLLKKIATLPYPTLRLLPGKQVDAALTATIRTRRTNRVDVVKAYIPPSADEAELRKGAPAALTSYRYETTVDLNIKDRKTGLLVAEVSATVQDTGTDENAVAYASWVKGVTASLSQLSKNFPQEIQGVYLAEAQYVTVVENGSPELETALVKSIDDASTGRVSSSRSGDNAIVRVGYKASAAAGSDESLEGGLLGSDALLPDSSIVSSERRNWLEVQVGD